MPEWISVKERLPEMKTKLLVCGPRGGICIAKAFPNFASEQFLWWKMVGTNKYVSVTHWMPLPEPPKEGGGEDG